MVSSIYIVLLKIADGRPLRFIFWRLWTRMWSGISCSLSGDFFLYSFFLGRYQERALKYTMAIPSILIPLFTTYYPLALFNPRVAHDRYRLRALVNTVMNFRLPQKAWNVSTWQRFLQLLKDSTVELMYALVRGHPSVGRN